MATLQARLALGDQAAFAELYDTYANRIGHYLLVRLSSRDNADDVLQETFLRLANIRHKLAKVNDLDAYVLTIARNEAARLAPAMLAASKSSSRWIAKTCSVVRRATPMPEKQPSWWPVR